MKLVVVTVIFMVLLCLFSSGLSEQSSCPVSPYSVTTTLTFGQTVDSLSDAVSSLYKCFNIQPCQVQEYSVGQCGGSKMVGSKGMAKASSVQLNPGGCTPVYNCGGVYVTSEVYQTILAHECLPYDNEGSLVGVCAGMVVPEPVLQQITCGHCNGADWCRVHCQGYQDCTPMKNCDQDHRRHLLASDLPCSILKVTFNTAGEKQAALIKDTLIGPRILKQLNYCLKDVNITSAGPTSINTNTASGP
eukprot:jgi/Botrbrau1/10848/Bobra.0025s0026.1